MLFIIVFTSCNTKKTKEKFFTENIPKNTPIEFKVSIISDNKIIHKGVFSPDLKEYYYTVSDKNFKNFDVYIISRLNNRWSKPKEAFFNSKDDDHGMSFSPDGNSIYFSSTRPVNIDGILSTWHIWRSDNIGGKWSKPVYVDIPNMRSKLISHPSITNSGTLYYHSSNLDYSEMDIYRSKLVNNKFSDAEKVFSSDNVSNGRCTPYVSPNEKYLIFASIEDQLNLNVSFKKDQNDWSKAIKLNNEINSLGQGNPYLTPDNKFLFFTTGDHEGNNWRVKWVDIESDLKMK